MVDEHPLDCPAAYTHAAGSGAAEISRLIEWLGVPATQITIVAPGVRNLAYWPVVRDLVDRGARALPVQLEAWSPSATVLALWLNNSGIAAIEESKPARFALAAPFNLAQIELWRQAREPVELTGAAVPGVPELDPVVAVAMRHLLVGRNRADAIGTFRILRNAGYQWDPVAAAAAMVRGGWGLNAGAEFAELAAEMLARPAVHGGHELHAGSLGQWRDEAARE
jgi:hypothetical protein